MSGKGGSGSRLQVRRRGGRWAAHSLRKSLLTRDTECCSTPSSAPLFSFFFTCKRFSFVRSCLLFLRLVLSFVRLLPGGDRGKSRIRSDLRGSLLRLFIRPVAHYSARSRGSVLCGNPFLIDRFPRAPVAHFTFLFLRSQRNFSLLATGHSRSLDRWISSR